MFITLSILRNEVMRRRSGDRLRQSGDGRKESTYHPDRTRIRTNDVTKQVSYASIFGIVFNTFTTPYI